MFVPGQVLDSRYEIIAPLAEGGMGAVYRARRTLLGDEVAIKVVLQDSPHPEARERFLRESRIAASLRHPSVVAIFDFDMSPGGDPYLVMELLSGPSLREEIAARGRLEPSDVHRIVPEICAALQLAHSRGVVHRDIKPANIVAHEYAAGQQVYKLVDFGIANLRQSTADTRLTAPYQFVGTIAYAAPEQLSGGAVDARTDVYALAAVVFEMLTGRVPFEGSDIMAVVTAQMSGQVPRLRDLRPELPEWLDAAIAKGLAKDPEDRWPTAAVFGAALIPEAIRASETGTVPGLRPAPVLLAGTYELEERIGAGRLGSDVHRGVHRALGHPVAIRILRSNAHPNWGAVRERFLREARALQLAHESVIQVRDYGEEPGFVYLVTDLIEGPSVRTLLAQEGAIPWRRLHPLLLQLLEAVRQLHRRKALICGMSPEIMRIRTGTADAPGGIPETDDERLMISTAGIWSAQDLFATLHDSTLRGTSIADVELRYIAPELLTGGGVDCRSDIFTIGVLAYEMATGRVPYDGRSMPELLGKMLAGAPADPRATATGLPDAVAEAILRALRPVPGDRFATVREFSAAFGDRRR